MARNKKYFGKTVFVDKYYFYIPEFSCLYNGVYLVKRMLLLIRMKHMDGVMIDYEELLIRMKQMDGVMIDYEELLIRMKHMDGSDLSIRLCDEHFQIDYE